MKYEKISEIIKSENITIPLYIYKEYPGLNINLETFLFLMYLYNKGNKIPFDIHKLSEEFFCDIKKILEYIDNLQKNKLIEIKVLKNDKNIMEEFIYLDFFYEKILLKVIKDTVEESKAEDDKRDVFSILEKEIGKQLSPMEIEIVKAWKESNYSDEMIKEAIKESVINNATSLRYIDKILYEWAKRGITTKEKIEQNRKEFRQRTKEKTSNIKPFDYDWLDDDEDD